MECLSVFQIRRNKVVKRTYNKDVKVFVVNVFLRVTGPTFLQLCACQPLADTGPAVAHQRSLKLDLVAINKQLWF
jgi:hypothetical protein